MDEATVETLIEGGALTPTRLNSPILPDISITADSNLNSSVVQLF